ncbi:Gfo/Idh/MocA family protein [Aurantimonas endophytica]|uniref:Putative dehydrogenase n=1 Tax=Aurantimonas endophytica TaxID=1522175 RepID=A0A7W6MRX8_9HYPH|nr:Gfo/Idh/MocA family oxidoreductase [Aurantimonas endophytica]MBB4005448.1 putative dehydrogenase [Aurantimonas endophytica]MCO6405897.1 Gfo/Idh/MocA family oxidoreductase [Aurantimonas endophytica]
MLNWGILSTAKIGRDRLIPAIAESLNGSLVAIASRDGERAFEIAATYGIRQAFGSYEALLASPDVEAVYIPLPTAQHAEWTLKAIAAGKHVLCEKPMGMNAAEIAEIAAAAEAAGIVVAEAFMITYHPQWLTVRDLVASGAIGRLRHVESTFSYHNVDPANMRNRPELGGGALRDIGVYPLVAARFATGLEPRRVRANVVIDPAFGTDSFVTGTADFGDFGLSLTLGTGMAHRQTMVFHGEDGVIEVAAPFNAGLYDGDSVTLHDRQHRRAEIFRFPGVNQYRLQVEAFAEKARGRDVALFPLESSRRNQAAIDALFEAGRTGDWVDVAG